MRARCISLVLLAYAHTTRYQARPAAGPYTLRRARILARPTRDVRVAQVRSGYVKALFLETAMSCTGSIVHVPTNNAQERQQAAGVGEETLALPHGLILQAAACPRSSTGSAPARAASG